MPFYTVLQVLARYIYNYHGCLMWAHSQYTNCFYVFCVTTPVEHHVLIHTVVDSLTTARQASNSNQPGSLSGLSVTCGANVHNKQRSARCVCTHNVQYKR